MATYSQQCSKVGSFSYAKNFTLYVVLTNRDGNSSTNKSIVDFNVYCRSSGSGSIDAKHALYFSLNNTPYRNETVQVKASSPNANIAIASGSVEISHEGDGTKTIPFSASIKANSYGVSASVSGNFTLNTIPRYANLTSLTVASRTINSVTFNYTTDRTARLYCSIDGGNTWLNNGNPFVDNTTSGSFTVYYADRPNTTRLSPNTTYSFYVLCRSVDSWLDTGKVISASTYDFAKITSAPNFTDEQNPTINYTNPFGNNVTSLQACISLTGQTDDVVYRDVSKTGTSYTFNLTDAERNVLRKAATTNSLAVHFYLRTTYNQDYQSTSSKTMSIVNANPTFSNFTYKDVNSSIVDNLTGNNQTIVKGYSMVQATVSAANKAVAKKGATMSKYRLSIGEKTNDASYSSSSDVSMRIDYVNNNVFTVYAIDSRQNSSFKQVTASKYIPYEPIVIKQIQAVRTNSVTSQTTLTFSGSMWAGSFGLKPNDIIACSYRYKKTTSNTWINGTTNLGPVRDGNGSGSNFSLSVVIAGDLGANGFDIDNSYNIQVLIEDRLSSNYSNPATFILGPGTPAMAIYKNNIAIGQRYDTSLGGKQQINGDLKFKDAYNKILMPGSVTDDRKLSIDTGNYNLNASSIGGWANGIKFRDNSGNTSLGLIGAMGDKGELKYYFIGKAYDDTLLEIYPGGTVQASKQFYTETGGSYCESRDKASIRNNSYGQTAGNSYNVVIAQKTTNGCWCIGNLSGDNKLKFIYTTDTNYNSGNNTVTHQIDLPEESGTIQLKPKTLFNNTSGTTGTVTLNETAANFSYIDVVYSRDAGTYGYQTKRLYAPNGKRLTIDITEAQGAYMTFYTSKIAVSGTSISFVGGNGMSISNSFQLAGFVNVNEIKIFKVLGYK